jgi:hypothetical protein
VVARTDGRGVARVRTDGSPETASLDLATPAGSVR